MPRLAFFLRCHDHRIRREPAPTTNPVDRAPDHPATSILRGLHGGEEASSLQGLGMLLDHFWGGRLCLDVGNSSKHAKPPNMRNKEPHGVSRTPHQVRRPDRLTPCNPSRGQNDGSPRSGLQSPPWHTRSTKNTGTVRNRSKGNERNEPGDLVKSLVITMQGDHKTSPCRNGHFLPVVWRTWYTK